MGLLSSYVRNPYDDSFRNRAKLAISILIDRLLTNISHESMHLHQNLVMTRVIHVINDFLENSPSILKI